MTAIELTEAELWTVMWALNDARSSEEDHRDACRRHVAEPDESSLISPATWDGWAAAADQRLTHFDAIAAKLPELQRNSWERRLAEARAARAEKNASAA